MISYATFNPDTDYKPTTFTKSLCEKANTAWNAYVSGEICNIVNDVDCMGSPHQVSAYFTDLCSEEEKLDPNFDEIVDDIELFVDENNASMQ